MEWITISLSTLALGLSAVNLWRSIRATPKVRLEAVVEPDYRVRSFLDGSGEGSYEARGLEVTITNHGNGMAHDVQIEVPSTSDVPWIVNLEGIESNGKRTKEFYVPDSDLLSGIELTLSWVEYPSGKRQRMPLTY